jgi:hypothetical protein
MISEEPGVLLDQRFVDRPMFGVELAEQVHEKPVAAAVLKLLDLVLVQRCHHLVLKGHIQNIPELDVVWAREIPEFRNLS